MQVFINDSNKFIFLIKKILGRFACSVSVELAVVVCDPLLQHGCHELGLLLVNFEAGSSDFEESQVVRVEHAATIYGSAAGHVFEVPGNEVERTSFVESGTSVPLKLGHNLLKAYPIDLEILIAHIDQHLQILILRHIKNIRQMNSGIWSYLRLHQAILDLLTVPLIALSPSPITIY